MSDDVLTLAADTAEIGYEELCGALAAKDLSPLWKISKQLMPLQHRSATRPWLWRWATLLPLARRCGELVTIDRGGDRRVLALANPGLRGQPYTSTTLWGAIQYLGAHESAPAHRHTPNAIRFVMQGQGVWTTVDGDACDMLPGDLILTPNWHWHDHTNSGSTAMVWFDGLDLPLVSALEAVFFELYPGELQPIAGHNLSQRRYGTGVTAASPGAPASAAVEGSMSLAATGLESPLLRYPYSHTDELLSSILETASDGVAAIRYRNPLTGRSALPTLGMMMTRLRGGAHTTPLRRTGSSVVVVHRGSGYSVIGGERFDWVANDIFVVPSWTAVEHHAHESGDLFSIDDRPVLEVLGLYREESLDQPQPVTGTFVPR